MSRRVQCSKTYADAEFPAELDHLVWRHVGDVLVFLVEVLGEVGVLDLRVVDRRQRVYYLHRHTETQVLSGVHVLNLRVVDRRQRVYYLHRDTNS